VGRITEEEREGRKWKIIKREKYKKSKMKKQKRREMKRM
jgi:hypothetical protein